MCLYVDCRKEMGKEREMRENWNFEFSGWRRWMEGRMAIEKLGGERDKNSITTTTNNRRSKL